MDQRQAVDSSGRPGASTSPKRCASCRTRLLEPLQEYGAEIDACLGCGGLWFESGELARAIRTHDAAALPSGRVFDSLGQRGGRTERSCPQCGTSLVEYSLSAENPLPIDVCDRCAGIWLERDELARAQAGHQLEHARQTIEREPTWGHWIFQLLCSLPVEFNIRPRRRPIVTFTLIAFNVVAFLAFLAYPSDLGYFALYADQLGQPQWWLSLLTSQFIHLGLIHLLGNMYFLWILGDNVEDLLGPAKFLAFYFAAAVSGDVAYSLLTSHREVPTAGASGAISGLMAAYAVYFRHSKLTFMVLLFQFKLPAAAYVGIWGLFNVVAWLVASSGIAWEAHAGGFLFGLVFGFGTYGPLLRRRPLLRLLNGMAAPG